MFEMVLTWAAVIALVCILYAGVGALSYFVTKKWKVGFYLVCGWIGFRTVNLIKGIYELVRTELIFTETAASLASLTLFASFAIVSTIAMIAGTKKAKWKI